MRHGNFKKMCFVLGLTALTFVSSLGQKSEVSAMNPYLPEWEHIPDGEPYVFADPDNPGEERLYVYGSHDTKRDAYCGYDITVWSAPVEDLTDWRCEGVAFEYSPDGEKKDTLYAPDVAEVTEEDGTKTYYLYPNNQTSKRSGMVAKSKSPAGPFEVINIDESTPADNPATEGVLGFDPAVFVDDDGRVYGYWGFRTAYMAELDPETMATVKEGTEIISDVFEDDVDNEGPIRFFEASSMRKIGGKYVFIYSRKSQDGEFGLGPSTGTLAYLYSDSPLGPWTYGGTIVDARARNVDESGKTYAGMPATNTHGSLVEVNGQWYIFYHRSINNDGGYSRQGMADPVNVEVTADGRVVISEAEVTSQGLEINGLDPMKQYSAGIACHTTGGSYIKATWDPNDIGGAVSENKNGAVVGYKYFNFTDAHAKGLRSLALTYTGNGNSGTITARLDSPYASQGKDLCTFEVSATDSTTETTTKTSYVNANDLGTGKHAIYFIFNTDASTSLCDFNSFAFTTEKAPNEPAVTPTPIPAQKPAVSTSTPAPQKPAETVTPVETQKPTPEVKIANVGKAKIKALKAKKKKAVLQIKKQAGVKGYEVQYATSKKFKNSKKKTTKKLSVTLKKLKKKTYYVRVRAYTIVDGTKQYGAWSTVKKVKIRK